MSQTLNGNCVAFLATDGVETVELTKPWAAVEAAGAVPTLVSIEPGKIQAYDHLTPGKYFDVDLTASEAHAEEFDALVLPGGVANPDRLRTDNAVIGFVRGMVEAGAPIGVICHGPWTLVSAGAVAHRRLTSWPSLRDDLVHAGAEWVDEEVVVDSSGPNVIVSSRKPEDLDAFCEEIVGQFEMPDEANPSVSGRSA